MTGTILKAVYDLSWCWLTWLCSVTIVGRCGCPWTVWCFLTLHLDNFLVTASSSGDKIVVSSCKCKPVPLLELAEGVSLLFKPFKISVLLKCQWLTGLGSLCWKHFLPRPRLPQYQVACVCLLERLWTEVIMSPQLLCPSCWCVT